VFSTFLRFLFCLGAAIFLFPRQASAQQGTVAPFHGVPPESHLTDPSIERKVVELLKQMSLEEKVGQLVQYSVGTPTGPGTGRGDYQDMIASGQVGSLFNLNDAQAANHFQHIAVEKSRLHIPLLFGLDVIHGYRTTFPVPLGLASTWDPAVVEKAARVAAHEAAAAGGRFLPWWTSPVIRGGAASLKALAKILISAA
jgi:beta-glucosidase